jgi:hypothetical protein
MRRNTCFRGRAFFTGRRSAFCRHTLHARRESRTGSSRRPPLLRHFRPAGGPVNEDGDLLEARGLSAFPNGLLHGHDRHYRTTGHCFLLAADLESYPCQAGMAAAETIQAKAAPLSGQPWLVWFQEGVSVLRCRRRARLPEVSTACTSTELSVTIHLGSVQFCKLPFKED